MPRRFKSLTTASICSGVAWSTKGVESLKTLTCAAASVHGASGGNSAAKSTTARMVGFPAAQARISRGGARTTTTSCAAASVEASDAEANQDGHRREMSQLFHRMKVEGENEYECL